MDNRGIPTSDAFSLAWKFLDELVDTAVNRRLSWQGTRAGVLISVWNPEASLETWGIMKVFFTPVPAPGHGTSLIDEGAPQRVPSQSETSPDAGHAPRQARVAVYDSVAAAPRITDIRSEDVREFIEDLSSHVYMYASELGGLVPYTVIREVVENLIHADFREVVVSVLGGGSEIRFADQGPGISDKDRALRPGFTTATSEMKRFIRGVGSGLPIVHEYLSHSGGTLDVEDNLGQGTVITLRAAAPEARTNLAGGAPEEAAVAPPGSDEEHLEPPLPRLTLRQNKVLSLVMEYGSAGPSLVSRELGVGLSTAYRDLAALERAGLIVSADGGKRVITSDGTQYLNALFGWDRE